MFSLLSSQIWRQCACCPAPLHRHDAAAASQSSVSQWQWSQSRATTWRNQQTTLSSPWSDNSLPDKQLISSPVIRWCRIICVSLDSKYELSNFLQLPSVVQLWNWTHSDHILCFSQRLHKWLYYVTFSSSDKQEAQIILFCLMLGLPEWSHHHDSCRWRGAEWWWVSDDRVSYLSDGQSLFSWLFDRSVYIRSLNIFLFCF